MAQPLNFKDLFLRMLVIFLTSLVVLFLTRENSFDLQFKIRKKQETFNQLLIIEVANNDSIEDVLKTLKSKGVENIYLSHFLEDDSAEAITPYIVSEKVSNYLSIDLPPDGDGLTRRVKFLNDNHPKAGQKPLTINYRGPENSFSTINYYDLAASGMDLKDKVVVVKSTKPINYYTTPVGLLSEAEIVATLLDNQFANRFIPPKSFIAPIIILFALMLITTLFLIYLPSTLALISTVVLGITYLSLSLWTFDTFSFWTPLLAPIIQFTLTFLLISNYKFVLNEKTRWSLERESVFFNQVEEMKTNFLSLFSHDLKTPLAKIIGIVDTLKSKIDDPEIHSELDKIHQSSLELDKYIKKILKMSQIQSKSISLNKEPTDLNQLIDQAVQQNLHLAQSKGIQIQKKTTPLFMVDIDPSLVKEVIINFLENAITYSPKNSQVTVISDEVEDFIKVSVIDEGNGIPKNIQENIWEKSFRFDKEKSGYGLGLFLSRYVIHLHGGQVFLNSRENSGSEFGFLIPLSEENNNETS